MRIALLSQGGKRLYSNRRLLEAAESRGHEIKVVPTLKCCMDIASHQPSVHLEGKELGFFDAVIPMFRCSGDSILNTES